MLLIKTWAPHFQSSIRMRGRAYHRDGRVKLVPAQNGEIIRAEVTGTKTYTVTIHGEGSAATPNCTCEYFAGGAFCKHIWAVLLSVYHDNDEPGPEQPPIEAINPRMPKARRRTADRGASRNAEPDWSARLSLLRTPAMTSPDTAAVGPAIQKVCYVVRPDLASQRRGLVIELQYRQPTTTGWSNPRPLKLSPVKLRELPDATDRELCSLLLGATRADDPEYNLPRGEDRRSSVYHLPLAAQRSLLTRMIDTGRCFFESTRGMGLDAFEPLKWDAGPPWVLWMTATEDEQGLLAELELRRGEQRLSISEPSYVFGGFGGVVIHDGAAAAFDDRGASRWVTQFQDAARQSKGASSLRVPTADVTRFLRRLYLLPELPRLDLPELLQPPQRSITPEPYIELTRDEAGSTAGGSTTAAGNGRTVRCAARVWFQYDTYKIKPGQPGRFICAGDHTDVDESETQSVDVSDTAPDIAPTNGHKAEATDAATADVDAITVIPRDSQFERDAIETLWALGFQNDASTEQDEILSLPGRHVSSAVSFLIRRGWRVWVDQQVVRAPSPVALSVRSHIDWFELQGSVQYAGTDSGDEAVGLPAILAAARAGRSMIPLSDGSMGFLPQQWLDEHQLLMAVGQVEDDHVRFRSSQVFLLDALLSQQRQVDVDEQFRVAREKIANFEGIEPIEADPTFTGELRPYQKGGLGWLDFLRSIGIGGVLADDMGLGKTIQVLAMLDTWYSRTRGEAKNGDGKNAAAVDHLPTLIVVPKSVVFNWIDEAERFAPKLRTVAYTGTDRHCLRDEFHNHDVIVTSYGLVRRDVTELRNHRFEYVVLDEAQAIKNPASLSAKAARLLEANHKLALSGTPVENHLGDLWSIFEFLNPGMLGSHTAFARIIREALRDTKPHAIRLAQHPDILDEPASANADDPPDAGAIDDTSGPAQVARVLRPFILRRTKSQVLADLPSKTEQTIICQMEPKQRKVYDQLLKHYRGTLIKRMDDEPPKTDSGLGGSTMMVLEALLRLRQAACHPALIDPDRADEPSAKMTVLLERLEELIEEGHKALVFSQFTSMLALVRKQFEAQGIEYEYLDGQTRDRQARVKRFQTDPDCPVFLISLKAGGLGLNLTAAEYVFILDPWWNPAVEAQAIDRSHRIGQTNRVFAYRLICQDTVEQRIAELQTRKQTLADAIVGGQQNLLQNLTRQDLEQLLR